MSPFYSMHPLFLLFSNGLLSSFLSFLVLLLPFFPFKSAHLNNGLSPLSALSTPPLFIIGRNQQVLESITKQVPPQLKPLLPQKHPTLVNQTFLTILKALKKQFLAKSKTFSRPFPPKSLKANPLLQPQLFQPLLPKILMWQLTSQNQQPYNLLHFLLPLKQFLRVVPKLHCNKCLLQVLVKSFLKKNNPSFPKLLQLHN